MARSLAPFATAQEIARAAALDALDATAVAATTTTMGSVTAGAVAATTLTATGAAVLSNASVTIANLGTVDPTVAGRLWSNKGIVTVSAG